MASFSGRRREFQNRGTLMPRPSSHRQFASALVCGAFLPPHPSPLPEERENRRLRFRQSSALRLVAARDAVFPLLQGEGQGGKPERKCPSSPRPRSEEHTSELQSLAYLVCRLLLEKKKKTIRHTSGT